MKTFKVAIQTSYLEIGMNWIVHGVWSVYGDSSESKNQWRKKGIQPFWYSHDLKGITQLCVLQIKNHGFLGQMGRVPF